MKKFYLIILLICSVFSFGQIKSVSKKVQDLNSKQQQFKKYDLFSANDDARRTAKYFTSATDVTVLNLNEQQLDALMRNSPEYIQVAVPYQNEIVEVELFKNNILTDSFIARDEKGNVLNYKLGEYYRGIVKGDYESIVAISFFEGDVMGVISSHKHGNITVGKSTDKQEFISFSDKNILGENPFVCGIDEIDSHDHGAKVNFDPQMMSTTMTENCVKIYYEIAYQPYFRNGSNIQNTINWITGIQNNIGTLYSNDNINVALHEVKIWTTQDPYNGSFSENLAQFRNTVTEFSGDLAHLVNYPSTTSVAYLNSLCTTSNYAYSGINMSYGQVPTYSWTIMAMTHEMGHSLGSPHTHACAWNGNNTAIDGCGPAGGANEGCNAPFPSNGGTIMSYCHLVPSVGINFLNGFGEQPGALIRATVDSKTCLGTDCSCQSTIDAVDINYVEGNQVQATITDSASSEWQYKVYPYGSSDTGEWRWTENKIFIIEGLQSEMYYEILVTNMCGSSEGGQRKAIILTGDFCDGTLFTDTGGATQNYQNNQQFLKTFYPAAGSAVSLSFNRIGLQTNSDYMYVYNGNAVNDESLFENGTINGNNNPGPTFTSTHSTGAITVKFESDGVGAAYGWEATVNCNAVLGIEDLSNSKGVSVYPNPTTSVLNIDAQKEIISVKLNDISGKAVLNKKANSSKEKLNIEHLPKGVYILTIEMKGQTVTKKIIKN